MREVMRLQLNRQVRDDAAGLAQYAGRSARYVRRVKQARVSEHQAAVLGSSACTGRMVESDSVFLIPRAALPPGHGSCHGSEQQGAVEGVQGSSREGMLPNRNFPRVSDQAPLFRFPCGLEVEIERPLPPLELRRKMGPGSPAALSPARLGSKCRSRARCRKVSRVRGHA